MFYVIMGSFYLHAILPVCLSVDMSVYVLYGLVTGRRKLQFVKSISKYVKLTVQVLDQQVKSQNCCKVVCNS